jgi:hypothetical protein
MHHAIWPPAGLLIAALTLSGCTGLSQVFHAPIAVEELEGDYSTLASCTYEQLARRQTQAELTHIPEQKVVRIAHPNASQKRWELSFINEVEGRQARLEVSSPDRSSSVAHVLALARACAA